MNIRIEDQNQDQADDKAVDQSVESSTSGPASDDTSTTVNDADSADNVANAEKVAPEVDRESDLSASSANNSEGPKKVKVRKSRKRIIITIVVIIVVLGLLGVLAAFLYPKLSPDNLDPQYNDAKSSQTVKKEEQEASDKTPAAKLVEYTNEKYGITMQIPSDWEKKENPQSAELIADDKKNNISFHFFISKETNIAMSCNNVVKATEELTYKNPLPGQRTVTHLTYTSISPVKPNGPNTLCSIMVTGAYAPVPTTAINLNDPEVQKQLPTNRIVVEVSNMDNGTNFPELSKAIHSYRHDQVVAALETLQVK